MAKEPYNQIEPSAHAKRAAARIALDIGNRQCLGDAYAQVDANILQEIKAEWARIIENEIRRAVEDEWQSIKAQSTKKFQ